MPRLAAALALLLTLAALAGCLGSSDTGPSSAPGNGSTQSPDGGSGTEDDGTGSPDGADGNGTDEGNTTETTTIDNSTTVTFNAAAGGVVLIGAGDMTLLDAPPANYTGILLEFTWSTPTRDAGIGDLAVEVDDDADLSNATAGSEGPLRMRIGPGEYAEGPLHVWAVPAADEPNAWVQAEVTGYATVFTGGPPDWGHSAVPARPADGTPTTPAR